MKISLSFLAIVSAQVTDDYCRVREQMADNIKYYGDAIGTGQTLTSRNKCFLNVVNLELFSKVTFNMI